MPRTPTSSPACRPVRWSDGTTGVLTCARLDGGTLRLELVRGGMPVTLTLERLAPDYYAGPWAAAGDRPARGSASAAATSGVRDEYRLAGRWYEGAAVTEWAADGVTLG
ncbi:hypothetical protein [Gemmata sp.]|uniref:hypothetical protein n=1 Tax=Gemmata sp. TaxID=1914242 RepID=UPI003F6F7F7F